MANMTTLRRLAGVAAATGAGIGFPQAWSCLSLAAMGLKSYDGNTS